MLNLIGGLLGGGKGGALATISKVVDELTKRSMVTY